MPKINQEEYEVLKGLDDKWEWIARDELRNSVYVFYKKPNKYSTYWEDEDMIYEQIDENLFQFIKWEDEEPYSIAELIEEYEYSTEHVSHVVNERVKALGNAWKESEETEVNKQKLIEKWESAIEAAEFYGRGKEDRLIEYMRNFVDDLNQLDEPEVLSQEFIDKYKVDYDNWMPAVPIVHLQNLLVPKQELPVIPKFVAEWIKETKPYNSLRVAFEYIAQRKRDNHDDELALWVEEGNSEAFARAWLDGYTIEQEPKYRVMDGNTTLLGRINGLMLTTVEILEYYPEYTPTFEFTEQEIKDYDERYFAFAKPVEEMEEC